MTVTQGLQSLLAVFVVAVLTPGGGAGWSVRAGGPGVARQQRDG
jgi:hypothetical protein